MGSGESTTRKVSFGVDDEDRVRILRGVKISEDVLQRMKGVANIPPERPSSPASPPSPPPKKTTGPPTGSSSSPNQTRPQPAPQARPQPAKENRPQPAKENRPQSTKENRPPSPPQTRPASSQQPRGQTGSKPNPTPPTPPTGKEEEKRAAREQAILREELSKVAQREREAAREEVRQALSRERYLERERSNQLAQELQRKDTELKALDAFYKEQLAQLEKRNLERFQQSSDLFNNAASQSEANIRRRNTEAVCGGLQSVILSCYRENREQTLRCSDLAKQYMHCIDSAKKSLLVNH